MPAAMIQVPFGNAMVSRVEPLMPSSAYKTYGMSMPIKTHWVPATCEQVDCQAYLKGWVSTFDLSTDLGKRQYHYCSYDDKTRKYTEERIGDSLVQLTYAPGNTCFASGDHKLPLGRPAIFTVKDGDWRGNPRRTDIRVHVSAEDWVEDFATHQDRLAAEIQKG